jgi:hypothetical protein
MERSNQECSVPLHRNNLMLTVSKVRRIENDISIPREQGYEMDSLCRNSVDNPLSTVTCQCSNKLPRNEYSPSKAVHSPLQ